MKNIVLLNPKGGCGKTTIATHIASYAATLGLRVALADHDSQQSSLDWLKVRPRHCADITPISAYDGASLEGNYDVIVHDMPATMLPGCINIASACDKLLIPVMPSPIDLKATLRLWMTLSNMGWLDNDAMDISVIANRTKAGTKYLDTFYSFLRRINIPVVGSLRDTQSYIRALDAGLSLFDLPPYRVAKDLAQWEPIMVWADLFSFDNLALMGDGGALPEELSVDNEVISLEEFYDEKRQEELEQDCY